MDVRVGSGVDNAATENTQTGAEFHFTLKLIVEDAAELWALAAERCTDLSPEEIAETIGPREDPSVEDCLAMVVVPTEIAGCRMVDVALRPVNRADAEPRLSEARAEALPFAMHFEAPHLGRLPTDEVASGLIWRS